MYVVRHHTEIHVFRSKSKATEFSEWADREIETIRSEDYFWMVRPEFTLIAHDMTHRMLTIQPDGSVLVKLRPKHSLDSVMPIRYTNNEIIALRSRFEATFKPNFHSLAKNPELVNYVLNALGIQRSWKEEQKFLQVLASVFNMDEFAAMGCNLSDIEPVENHLCSDGMRNRLSKDGRRFTVRTKGERTGRISKKDSITVKVNGPEMRAIQTSKIYEFRNAPDVSFPFIRDYGTFENVTCKAHYNALRNRGD